MCEQSRSEATGPLAARLDELEGEIEALPPSEQNGPRHRQLQEQALIELERLQCATEAEAPAEEVLRGPAIETPFVTVPVLFLTDRQPIEVSDGAHTFFGYNRIQNGVSFGTVTVTMPAERYRENERLPIGMQLSRVRSASMGITVSKPETLPLSNLSELMRSYRNRLPPQSIHRLIVFVHGFNVSYVDAVKATARLAFALHIDSEALAISWPSQAETLKYWRDEDTIETSIERFRPVFERLLASPEVDEITIVAHSMGTRLVTRVLSQLQLQKVTLSRLSRLVYAAADIGEEEVRELWARIQPLGIERMDHLYVEE
jgi:esterase/lipase superfamily enzyme